MALHDYYLLAIRNFKKVASASVDNPKLSFELIRDLEGKNEFPSEFKLVKITVGRNGILKTDDLTDLEHVWLDYQPNSLAWPLMSERFKNLICDHLTEKEQINWIKAQVTGGGETRTYYIPRFEIMHDVLDVDQTLYVPGTDHVIRPGFSLAKIRELTIFNKPSFSDSWKITFAMYINETLKKAIVK